MKNKFPKIKSGMRFGLVVFCFFIFLTGSIFGQKDGVIAGKWPYFGNRIPPHMNVSGGFAGFNSKSFFVGLSFSPWWNYVSPKNTSCAGPRLYYKFYDASKKYKSYEAEFAIYSVIVMGINVNYNVAPNYNFIGFKPFIGFGYYHVTINYGYNFFNKKIDADNFFRHNIFHVTVDIPICKFSNKS
jgi:hypothetical protein